MSSIGMSICFTLGLSPYSNTALIDASWISHVSAVISSNIFFEDPNPKEDGATVAGSSILVGSRLGQINCFLKLLILNDKEAETEGELCRVSVCVCICMCMCACMHVHVIK